MQYSGSSSDKTMTWYDFVVTMDNDGSIEYKRISSESDNAEGSVGIFETKIILEFENEKGW